MGDEEAIMVAAGGSQMVPGTDIPPGRFSVVTSPSGAALSLFHESDEATSENPPGGLGSIHWTELHSKDIDADLEWLKATFGFEIGEMPMPNGATYYLLNVDGQPIGGAVAAMFEQVPSMWLSWVEVDEVDGTLSRIDRLGGKAHSPAMDIEGVGRMAVVADSTGGVFGVITPSRRAN